MIIRRTRTIASFVIGVHLCAASTIVALSIDPVFQKTFSQKFDAIAIENTSGRTEVQTWNSNRVRVTASQESGKTSSANLDARIRFQIQDSVLRIIVGSGRSDEGIDLLIFVPRQVSVGIKGDNDSIAVKGIPNALTVETESGAISLYVPRAANTDLSLRSVEGKVTSQLEMRVFGPVNEHTLDGQTGRGGTPIILRSLRGSVSLLTDEPGRIARANALVANDLNANSIGSPFLESTAQSTEARAQAGLEKTAINSADSNDPPVADVIKIDSRLVNLNVRVTDQTGKLIPDLIKSDFQVFEDNVEQEVARFEPVTSPVNVVILLDASSSTRERWTVIKKSAKKFIDTLNASTPIAVAAFTRRFMLICDFTCDRKKTKQRIDDSRNLQSGTAFYDATWSALDLFKDVKDHRKAIVVLTDGVDNSLYSEEFEPRHPFDELLARISKEEVTIYPIYFDTEFQVTVMDGVDTHESYVTARQQLNKIADETGGTLFKADRAEDLDGAYQRVASELQTLYSVSYNPADKNYNGNWRNVGIKIKREQALARTKRGFYAR